MTTRIKLIKTIKLTYFKIINLPTSLKILYFGILCFIISIASLIILNSKFIFFKEMKDLIPILISLTIGLSSFVIGIASVYYTKEQTIYGINYEKRKIGLIRLYNILFYNTIFFAPKIKLDFIKFVLELQPKQKELEQFLRKLKNGPTISTKIVTEETKKPFLEDLIEFKKNYEIYYLPKELLYEINIILEDKTEITQNDVEKIIKIIEKYVEKEYGIRL